MLARAQHLALPSGASAPAAFAAPSNSDFAQAAHQSRTARRAFAAPHAVAAEATATWGQPPAPHPVPPASLGEARSLRDHLTGLLAHERTAAADFLVALADFDRKRGWEALGHASLFAFLTRELHLSGAAAYARLSAARLLPRFPEVESALQDGRLCVTSTGELAKVLTRENLAEVLPKFFGLSSREAKAEVAALSPRELPRSPALVTRLAVLSLPAPEAPFCVVRAPEQHNRVVAMPAEETAIDPAAAAMMDASLPVASPGTPDHDDRAGGATAQGVGPGTSAGDDGALGPALAGLAPSGGAGLASSRSQVPLQATVEPLTADHRRLHLTVRTAFLDKLRAARRGLAHANPGASLEAVLEAALDLLLEKQARRRGEAQRPRRAGGERDSSSPSSSCGEATPGAGRHIPASVRREVWARDGHRCQFPLDSGGTCGSTHLLELDHLVPVALGGAGTPANLRVTCRAHNLAAAREVLGEARMADRGRTGRRRPPQGHEQ